MPTLTFTAITPAAPHALSGRKARVLDTASGASRRFIGQTVTIGAKPGIPTCDGATEFVDISDGNIACACRLSALEVLDDEGDA